MPTQSDLRFTFTIGDEPFEVVEFTLQEGLSETFLLEVELASSNPAIDFGEVLDRTALLTIWHGDTAVRYVHGAVSSFVQDGTGFRRSRYSAIVEPRLARLSLSADWRIFQSQTVPQIAEAVLKAHGLTQDYEQRITTEHLAREYCVQAGDTDYHFVERLMREEGFFYSFRHSAAGHQLVHSDRLFIHGRVGDEPVQYNPVPGGDQPKPALRRFTYTENVRTARQTQRDYTFHHPRYTHQHSRDGWIWTTRAAATNVTTIPPAPSSTRPASPLQRIACAGIAAMPALPWFKAMIRDCSRASPSRWPATRAKT